MFMIMSLVRLSRDETLADVFVLRILATGGNTLNAITQCQLFIEKRLGIFILLQMRRRVTM